jgi:hypothetical protein
MFLVDFYIFMKLFAFRRSSYFSILKDLIFRGRQLILKVTYMVGCYFRKNL